MQYIRSFAIILIVKTQKIMLTSPTLDVYVRCSYTVKEVGGFMGGFYGVLMGFL